MNKKEFEFFAKTNEKIRLPMFSPNEYLDVRFIYFGENDFRYDTASQIKSFDGDDGTDGKRDGIYDYDLNWEAWNAPLQNIKIAPYWFAIREVDGNYCCNTTTLMFKDDIAFIAFLEKDFFKNFSNGDLIKFERILEREITI